MNPIVIEQAQGETKLAYEVNQNAAIQRIRLARATVRSRTLDEAPKGRIQVTFNFKSKAVRCPAGLLRLEIAFRMAGIETDAAPDDKKVEPVVLVECAYEVDYTLREGFVVSAAHVKAFKDGNAIFNAWPYFREYLQNNLQRMGYPALTAPFLRLQSKASLGK